jgi:hypothetical protein
MSLSIAAAMFLSSPFVNVSHPDNILVSSSITAAAVVHSGKSPPTFMWLDGLSYIASRTEVSQFSNGIVERVTFLAEINKKIVNHLLIIEIYREADRSSKDLVHVTDSFAMDSASEALDFCGFLT